MQVEIPQIRFHYESKDIFSIDFCPNTNVFVTASIYNSNDCGLRV